MLRRRMLNIRAASRKYPDFSNPGKSRHKSARNFSGAAVMATTLGWTGVTLWLGLNAVVAFWCMDVTRPARTADTPDHAPDQI